MRNVFLFAFIMFNFLYLGASAKNIIITNESPYTVYIGRTSFYIGIIAKIESGSYTNITLETSDRAYQKTVHFYPSYEIPLGDNTFVRIHENIAKTVVVGEDDFVVIESPKEIIQNFYYIILENGSDNAIELRHSQIAKPIYKGKAGAIYIAQDERGIFEYNVNEFYVAGYVSDDRDEIFLPEDNYEKGYVYYYNYDGENVFLESRKHLLEMLLDFEKKYDEAIVLYNEALLPETDVADKVYKLFEAVVLVNDILGDHPESLKYIKLKESVDTKILGLDIDAKNNDGETALIEAAYEGNTETVKALLSEGANIEAKVDSGYQKGYTALIWAAYWGKTETVKALT